MKIQELAKKTGLKLAAIIVIGGVLMFTFTGCGNKPAEPVMSESVSVETVVETAEEDLGTVAGGLYAEDAEIEDGQEAEISEEYTIDFVDAGNEDIEAESNEMVTIPEYERPQLIDIIGEVFTEFDVEDTDNFTVLETVENEDGSKTHLVSLASVDLTLGCTTQYSVDENENAKALFVYKPLNYADMLPEDFGLNFELTVDTEGKVEITKIVDIFGNDCSDITYFSGTCIGWSMSKGAVETDFAFSDEISVSQDIALYPVFEGADNPVDIDTTEGFWVIGYTGVPVQVGSEFSENDLNYMVVGGELISIDGTKVVNQETGEITDKPAETTNTKPIGGESSGSASGSEAGSEQEQGSTTGGDVGSTSPSGGTANVAPIDDGCTTAEEASSFWGVPVQDANTITPVEGGGSSGSIQW